jgi:AcrR family transcriptional regulator
MLYPILDVLYSGQMHSVKRPYRSPMRESQARRTRHRIVDAARRLWVERGMGATTVDAIAAEAGVSVQTVYGAFGSKGGILTALLDRLDAEAGGERLMNQLRATPTVAAQLDVVAAFNRRLFEGGADVIALAIGSAAVDPDVAAWAAEGDRRRREGQGRLVGAWHAAGGLSSRLRPSEAADILYTLTSPEVYLLLVSRCGWSPARYEGWLGATLRTLLLKRGARTRSDAR